MNIHLVSSSSPAAGIIQKYSEGIQQISAIFLIVFDDPAQNLIAVISYRFGFVGENNGEYTQLGKILDKALLTHQTRKGYGNTGLLVALQQA